MDKDGRRVRRGMGKWADSVGEALGKDGTGGGEFGGGRRNGDWGSGAEDVDKGRRGARGLEGGGGGKRVSDR